VLDRVLAAPDLDGQPIGRDPRVRATVLVVFASWCDRCREQMEMITTLAAERPFLRIVGVNVREHEEYDGLGDAAAVRAYAAAYAPLLRVVPAGDDLFDALGRPAKVPTLYVYDAAGALIEVYDRRVRTSPDRAELSAVLERLGT
jgi:thiol-disulfide isomerase/thioredoxin